MKSDSQWTLLLALLAFVVSFFLPVLQGSARNAGDTLSGYEAADASWSFLFNSYGNLIPDHAGTSSNTAETSARSQTEKTIFAALLLYSSSIGEEGPKDMPGEGGKVLVHVYSFCLQLAWISNAIPMLLLLVFLLRHEPARLLLLGASWLLAILACSFIVVSILSLSWPPYSMGYWVWAGSLAWMTSEVWSNRNSFGLRPRASAAGG